jgi:hypothetical protein
MVKWRTFPSSLRRGGCAIKKKLRSILDRAAGVVIRSNEILSELDHHPVRSIKEASRYFIDVAATHPQRGGESSSRSSPSFLVWTVGSQP